ncbi:MAG: amidohydrolase family protein [Aigarchaeota archaeon]|nr:amidohydrolase family protein [Aigarchaeota archaeon]MCX8192268.1 amidohydrolase family protein [Nitrososphaeria archaeon]MDW7986124.1 amidohydrolase family protein [Nitrososphaerota archaeon]
MVDILVKNAFLRKFGRLCDILIRDGRIVKIGRVEEKAELVIDAEGGLVTESFVNPHLHMCKVYTFTTIGEEALKHYHGEMMSGAMTAIELASRIKERYHESWIYENAKKAALEALRYGCTHIRAFVDTDTKAKLEGVKAILKLREELKDILTIKVVAFPQDGVLRDPGAEEFIWKAVEMGCDEVGGIPWIEYTDEDSLLHIDKMFEIAKRYNKDVAMLTDDAGDPSLRTTEMLALKAIREGWIGRVTACHARAMQLYTDPYFRKLVHLLKKADMSIVSDPHTGPLHARVRELLSHGVNVALGQDDIADAYYPYGRNKMLEVAFVNSHLLWLTSLADMDTLYDMITVRAAKAMNIRDHVLEENKRADLVILNVKSVYEAIWNQVTPRYVISNGRLVVENEEKTTFHIK